jgi:hypothetical protein
MKSDVINNHVTGCVRTIKHSNSKDSSKANQEKQPNISEQNKNFYRIKKNHARDKTNRIETNQKYNYDLPKRREIEGRGMPISVPSKISAPFFFHISLSFMTKCLKET